VGGVRFNRAQNANAGGIKAPGNFITGRGRAIVGRVGNLARDRSENTALARVTRCSTAKGGLANQRGVNAPSSRVQDVVIARVYSAVVVIVTCVEDIGTNASVAAIDGTLDSVIAINLLNDAPTSGHIARLGEA